ncbi:MAG: Gfo/Idh/MocA family oxidoreductase [Candidatus Hydrothermarchaeales archaeon]
MKAIIIGFGNIAEKGHLPTYHKLGIEIAAIVDICGKRREKARSYGLQAYESLEDVKEDADVIDICAPPNYRLEAVVYAAEKGLDVICEKPISHTSEAERIRDAVDEGGIFFFPVHNWKYAPQYQKARELIMGNGILEVQMSTHRTTYNPGNPDWNPDWRVKREISGGGILMDHGYHNIYLAMYLLGRKFREVKLKEIEYFPDSLVEKKARFELLFPEKVEINLDWNSTKREIRNVIYGDKVIQLLDDSLVVDGEVQDRVGRISKDSVHMEWYYSVFSDFLEKRKLGDNACFLEGLKVLEGLGELYNQARAMA